MNRHHPLIVRRAPLLPEMPNDKGAFVKRLRASTGTFYITEFITTSTIEAACCAIRYGA